MKKKIKIGIRVGSFLHYSLVIFTLESFQYSIALGTGYGGNCDGTGLIEGIPVASARRRTLSKMLDMVDFHERDGSGKHKM